MRKTGKKEPARKAPLTCSSSATPTAAPELLPTVYAAWQYVDGVCTHRVAHPGVAADSIYTPMDQTSTN